MWCFLVGKWPKFDICTSLSKSSSDTILYSRIKEVGAKWRTRPSPWRLKLDLGGEMGMRHQNPMWSWRTLSNNRMALDSIPVAIRLGRLYAAEPLTGKWYRLIWKAVSWLTPSIFSEVCTSPAAVRTELDMYRPFVHSDPAQLDGLTCH